MNVAYSEFQTAVGTAATQQGLVPQPADGGMQSAVVSDMKKSGFTVAAGLT